MVKGGAVRLKVTLLEVPFRLAVTVAVWALLMLPATTENDATVDPPATPTLVGTVSGAFLETVIATLDPPLGATEERVTVHTAEACDARAVGLQVSP